MRNAGSTSTAGSPYLTVAQARAELGVSAYIFKENFRPQLTEFPRGKRTVLFDRLEVERLKGESDPMWNKKKVSDALDHAWRAKWSQAKGARKKGQLKNIVEREIGGISLPMSYEQVEQWVFELQDKDLAAATIKSRLSMLRFALDLSCKRGWIKSVPPMPTIEPSHRKLRWMKDSEVKRLLIACDNQRYQVADIMRDVITFFLDTGARVSELLKVREDSLTVRGRKTYVEFLDRKAGDNLKIPLTNAAEEAIYRLIASEYWKSRIRGTRESAKRLESAQNWVTHRFTEIRNDAKLPDVTAHTLRHTFASRLVQRGVSIYKVGKLLGHSDIRMTERYSHLAPSSLDDAIQVLEPTPPDQVANMDDYRTKE